MMAQLTNKWYSLVLYNDYVDYVSDEIILVFATRNADAFFLFIQTAFEKPAYLKAIGYQEQNGEIESKDSYLERVKCLMKLYGALVQVPSVYFFKDAAVQS